MSKHYSGNITHNKNTFISTIEDFDGKATIVGSLFNCGYLIEMASGGLYWEEELKKAEKENNLKGPDTIILENVNGNLYRKNNRLLMENGNGKMIYNGCKWISVKHEAGCSCCCRGIAEFTYENKVGM
jgi:hypothetical protein